MLTLGRAARGESGDSSDELPDAPQASGAFPGNARKPIPAAGPCQVRRAGGAMAEMAENSASSAAGATALAVAGNGHPMQLLPCPPLMPFINWYARFLNGPHVKPMTPKEKAWLAVRNVMDPFNGITILGSSAVAIGSNSHSAYGPGLWGFGKYVGVSYSQDVTGEFFGTFLIPSIAHQDPHYHRMPSATMKRRIAHALYQVVWTQGDNGRGMVNYANVVGFAIDDGISNLYVPGRETALPATFLRYGTALASAPIDNFVTEFVPDLASHIHIQIVVIQRIINQVAKTDAAQGQP